MFYSGSSAAIWHSSSPLLQTLFGPAAKEAGIPPTWSGFFAALAAICAVAMAIRLMDDLLDAGLDNDMGCVTVAARLREAALPYALAAFACSAALAPALAVALFAASYAVGMVGDHNRLLPFRLRGWQEGVLIIILGAFGAGIACMGWALAFIIALQSYDDLVDRNSDNLGGIRNLCNRYGVGEVVLAGLSALLISLMLSPLLSVQGYLALLLIQITMPRHNAQGGSVNG
jgi:hypothetical protein